MQWHTFEVVARVGRHDEDDAADACNNPEADRQPPQQLVALGVAAAVARGTGRLRHIAVLSVDGQKGGSGVGFGWSLRCLDVSDRTSEPSQRSWPAHGQPLGRGGPILVCSVDRLGRSSRSSEGELLRRRAANMQTNVSALTSTMVLLRELVGTALWGACLIRHTRQALVKEGMSRPRCVWHGNYPRSRGSSLVVTGMHVKSSAAYSRVQLVHKRQRIWSACAHEAANLGLPHKEKLALGVRTGVASLWLQVASAETRRCSMLLCMQTHMWHYH